MNIFQLNDPEAESLGLITTKAKSDEIEPIWKDYYENSDDPDVDKFCEMLLEEHGIVAERTYIDFEINA